MTRRVVFQLAEDPVSKALVEGAGLIAEGVQVGMPAPTFSGGGFDGEDQSPPEPFAPLGLGYPHRGNVEPVPVGTAVGAAEDMLRRVATEYGQRLKPGVPVIGRAWALSPPSRTAMSSLAGVVSIEMCDSCMSYSSSQIELAGRAA